MEVKEEIVKGLTSKPRYLPVWRTFDQRGMEMYEKIQNESQYYYIHQEEKELLDRHMMVIALSIYRKCFCL